MKLLILYVTLSTSLHCYAFNIGNIGNIVAQVPRFFPSPTPPSPTPPSPTPPSPTPAIPAQAGFWAGFNGDRGCMLQDQIRGARNEMDRMSSVDMLDIVELPADVLDLIFDWDRAHKRVLDIKINLNVWLKEPFNIENCERFFKEFQADMNQLNRMKNAELIFMGGASAAEAYLATAPLIIGETIVAGIPALVTGAIVAFKKWSLHKVADRKLDNFHKCVDLQNKKLQKLQEMAKEQMREIEYEKKKNEKIEIQDIEV